MFTVVLHVCGKDACKHDEKMLTPSRPMHMRTPGRSDRQTVRERAREEERERGDKGAASLQPSFCGRGCRLRDQGPEATIIKALASKDGEVWFA